MWFLRSNVGADAVKEPILRDFGRQIAVWIKNCNSSCRQKELVIRGGSSSGSVWVRWATLGGFAIFQMRSSLASLSVTSESWQKGFTHITYQQICGPKLFWWVGVWQNNSFFLHYFKYLVETSLICDQSLINKQKKKILESWSATQISSVIPSSRLPDMCAQTLNGHLQKKIVNIFIL